MVTILRRGAPAVAALAAAALFGVPAIASAQPARHADMPPADTSAAGCPANTVCFFSGPNFTGTQSNWTNPTQQGCDAVSNPPTQSVINNSAYAWRFFSLANCGGVAEIVRPYGLNPFLSPASYSWSGFSY